MTAAHEHQSTNGCTVTLKLFLIIIMDVITTPPQLCADIV
jgi:hypothetical protein